MRFGGCGWHIAAPVVHARAPSTGKGGGTLLRCSRLAREGQLFVHFEVHRRTGVQVCIARMFPLFIVHVAEEVTFPNVCVVVI